MGMVSNNSAFCGPRSAQIEVSELCDVGCMLCYNFSPLLPSRNNQANGQAFLSFETFKKLAWELHMLGTKKIQIVGKGEPLLNPEIGKMIKFVVSLGMECILVTSGIHLTEGMIDELAMPNVRFWISLHAGTPDVWCKVHPRHSAEDFYRLKRRISILSKSKKAKITLHSVINNINYSETTNMVRFAVDTGVKNINIRPIWLNSELSSLRLNSEQHSHLQKDLLEAEKLAAKYFINNSIPELLKSHYFNCGNQEDKDLAGGKTTISTPCYIGWLFTRIDSSGLVFPCCGSGLVMGDNCLSKFSKIWFSDMYREFRRISKNIHKTGTVIEKTDCDKCGHYVLNVRADYILRLKFIRARINSFKNAFKSSPRSAVRGIFKNIFEMWE